MECFGLYPHLRHAPGDRGADPVRLMARHAEVIPIRLSPEQAMRLRAWITQEVDDAFSARMEQEAVWRECLRLYEGVPKNPVRMAPIENAPNTEITLGAIACDSLFAQVVDLIYNISPVVTARATNAKFVKHAKAIQTFCNHIATTEADMRIAVEELALDDIQLGTGILYTPWVEGITKAKSMTITEAGR